MNGQDQSKSTINKYNTRNDPMSYLSCEKDNLKLFRFMTIFTVLVLNDPQFCTSTIMNSKRVSRYEFQTERHRIKTHCRVFRDILTKLGAAIRIWFKHYQIPHHSYFSPYTVTSSSRTLLTPIPLWPPALLTPTLCPWPCTMLMTWVTSRRWTSHL